MYIQPLGRPLRSGTLFKHSVWGEQQQQQQQCTEAPGRAGYALAPSQTVVSHLLHNIQVRFLTVLPWQQTKNIQARSRFKPYYKSFICVIIWRLVWLQKGKSRCSGVGWGESPAGKVAPKVSASDCKAGGGGVSSGLCQSEFMLKRARADEPLSAFLGKGGRERGVFFP